ncbi:MAG: DUF502 domain-containing protein [Rhodobacteraceae bacterium]|nr:DUF502 domain-containing protein [Paracoccaceae bacterium]
MTQMFDKDPQPKPRTPWYSGLRNSFLTGIVVIAPVGLTVWLIWTVIGWVDGFVLPFVPDSYQPEALIKRVLGPETEVNIRGLGVIFFLLFTTLIGWLAKGLIGRSLIRYGETLVHRMPVVRSIYSGVKQIAETELDMSIEDAAKLVISAGLVYPPSQLGDAPDVVQIKDEKHESAD